ncbi:hypothetical protein [Mesorhizobium sp. M0088]|uniref:hypothetical protein n=1 Tax=Mesorhizobium sp. M0088 TaxID=2956873 RepID=UPI00333762F6
MRKRGHASMLSDESSWVSKQWSLSIENLKARPQNRRGALLITDEQLDQMEESLFQKHDVNLLLISRQTSKAA